MPAASVQQPTDSKDHDRCLTIISRYAGYFDVAAGCEAPAWSAAVGGVDRPRRVRIVAETIANWFWVHRQTNVK